MESTPSKGRIIDDHLAEDITRVEELSYELRIEDVMTKKVITLEPTMVMREVVDIFRQARISGAPVVSNGKTIGIVSMEDLIHCLSNSDLDATVSKYMTHEVLEVYGHDLVIEALKVFVKSQVGRLPVVDSNGKLIGILTKGDVTRGLLKSLQRYIQEEELRRYRASHLFEDIESDRSSLILRYNIKAHDFTHGGSASSNIKRALLRLGATPQIARRAGIAVYEAEINLIIHTTNGGIIRVEIEPHQISIVVYDEGPGIEDVEQALKPGFSTASEEVREMGFGAGMGLTNISRCVDHMVLESSPDKGTRLRMKIYLQKDESFRSRSASMEKT